MSSSPTPELNSQHNSVIWSSEPVRELSEYEWYNPEVNIWCVQNVTEALTCFCLTRTSLQAIYMHNTVSSAA
jgi:hypothetical protein